MKKPAYAISSLKELREAEEAQRRFLDATKWRSGNAIKRLEELVRR